MSLRLRLIGLVVLAVLPAVAILAYDDRAGVSGAVLAAVCGLFAVLAAWFGGAVFLRRPIAALQRDAAQQQTERALRDFNETLERRIAERTREFVEANERLAAEMKDRQQAETALRQAQKMEAVGELTSGIAHDFNNLLMVIVGNLGLLADRLTDEIDLRLVRGAQRGANRGAKLVDSLLAFSRRQALRPETVNPNRLIKEVSDILRRMVGDSVQVQFMLSPTVDPCRIDPSHFQSSLLNLIANARDAMSAAGGQISIETETVMIEAAPGLAAGPYVRITVSDTGKGMTPDVLEHACEPFFTTKEVGQANGLGLSQVYGFAKQSDGQLQIFSEPGVGTRVLLFLPSAHGEAILAEAPATLSMQPWTTADKTILVVEDDTDVREVVAENLSALGYQVLTAEDGRVALTILETGRSVDLMFTDISMPRGLRGDELARRAREARPGLKVVLTSGHVAVPDLSDLSCTMLIKPYEPEALARAIGAALAG